ncbi:MAG: shikimate kinase [Ruminococcaceae bacterium]|nr:shikimate kinase [Oscillospiraceae bacterium]
MNIILIGMPGCGKSTVGSILSRLIGFRFLDTDLVIQNMEGKVLQDVIDEDGLSAFMTAEERALCSVYCDSTVIATGGSAIYSERGMRYLSSVGKIVYMRAEISEIKKRLTNLASRGVAGAKEKSIETIFEERRPLYEKYADCIVDSDKGDAYDVALAIVGYLKKDIIASRK